ncbi:Hypothetical protein R9X50_00164300 [Acrodontium crateriforme]|uniref:Proline dehydrogenase n=1 Tax=Acrodontium crateriforme TaxID=150365 RepID=A0AAQ3R811_9PEZI|nr:Hypothetical protein R9X50_00164300 [Acrodontium crateriforme]
MKVNASSREIVLCAFVRRPASVPSVYQNRWRTIHTSSPKEQDVSLNSASTPPIPTLPEPLNGAERAVSTLSFLPLSQILRTYLITSISSSPTLLSASSSLLQRMLDSKGFLFSPERNPLLRVLLTQTFYKQFCAGSTAEEVARTCQELRSQGYSGVILEYALEVLKDAEGNELEDVATWRKGMLDSVRYSAEGDFIGLKWSGMGAAAMKLLAKNAQPSKEMDEAMKAVCSAAAAKNISLLPAAEETWTLNGYHSWTLAMQRIYNLNGKSVVYNTYQAYLKKTPEILAQHLELAKKENFTLGLKVVRGAYLATEERHFIHDTLEDTHNAYDGISSALIHRKHNETVKPIEGRENFPEVNVVLATHNMATVEKAKALRNQQFARGESLTPLYFAQLQGMADEVSCNLIAAAKNADSNTVKEKVFKCTTWGTMTECLNYLLRRAAENKDAASRTAETRSAMQGEIWRRMKSSIGLA